MDKKLSLVPGAILPEPKEVKKIAGNWQVDAGQLLFELPGDLAAVVAEVDAVRARYIGYHGSREQALVGLQKEVSMVLWAMGLNVGVYASNDPVDPSAVGLAYADMRGR